jgi:hypothetical protein
MLEDQLLLIVGLQYHGVFIEALDATAELHAAHQIDSQEGLVPAGVVEKSLLDILRQLVHCLFPFATPCRPGVSGLFSLPADSSPGDPIIAYPCMDFETQHSALVEGGTLVRYSS